MTELEEGGMFDEETMPDWMRPIRGVAHRRSIPPPDQQFPPQGEGGMLGMVRPLDGDRGRCLVNKCEKKRHSDAVCLCLYHIRENAKEIINFRGWVGEVTPTLFRKSRSLKSEFELAAATASAIMACPVSNFKLGHQKLRRMRKLEKQAESHNKLNLGMYPWFSRVIDC